MLMKVKMKMKNNFEIKKRKNKKTRRKHSNENFRTKIFIVTDSRDNPVSSKPAKLLKIYTKQT